MKWSTENQIYICMLKAVESSLLSLDLLFVESFILDDSSRWTIMRGFGK